MNGKEIFLIIYALGLLSAVWSAYKSYNTLAAWTGFDYLIGLIAIIGFVLIIIFI